MTEGSPTPLNIPVTPMVQESLQGWIPAMASDDEIREALEKAFDYRGDVTLTLRSGQKIEGYIFDRRSEGPGLDQCLLRLMPKDTNTKLSVRYSEIARLEFSGRDAAEGKSFEAWIRSYNERKARGQAPSSLYPDERGD